mmetsp:Transcript_21198/g.42637  ORF Transcript_21198/g.42637 Transcript_21198/m.42637 type:complete len:138 (+) Transcript_21198:90-503(+)
MRATLTREKLQTKRVEDTVTAKRKVTLKVTVMVMAMEITRKKIVMSAKRKTGVMPTVMTRKTGIPTVMAMATRKTGIPTVMVMARRKTGIPTVMAMATPMDMGTATTNTRLRPTSRRLTSSLRKAKSCSTWDGLRML